MRRPPPPPPTRYDASPTANEASSDLTQSAATGLLVNGSVNNGAASTFAQMAAFGNNRKGPASLYNGGVGVIFDTSSWDAAPVFAQRHCDAEAVVQRCADRERAGRAARTSAPPDQPIQISSSPISTQANDNATVLPGRVPTLLERGGNFSQTLNAAGQPGSTLQSRHGPALSGEHGSSQPASAGSSERISAAKRARNRPLQLSSAGSQLQPAE